MIGVHGSVSGFITVNLAERVAMEVVGGLLQDKFHTLCSQIIDGVGELTNLVAGGIKKSLSGTDWCFSHVTVPSVIVGQKYQIAYCRGLQYVSATFEHENHDGADDRRSAHSRGRVADPRVTVPGAGRRASRDLHVRGVIRPGRGRELVHHSTELRGMFRVLRIDPADAVAYRQAAEHFPSVETADLFCTGS